MKSIRFKSDDKNQIPNKGKCQFSMDFHPFLIWSPGFWLFLINFDPFLIKIGLILIHFWLKCQLNSTKWQNKLSFSMDFVICNGFCCVQCISSILMDFNPFFYFEQFDWIQILFNRICCDKLNFSSELGIKSSIKFNFEFDENQL